MNDFVNPAWQSVLTHNGLADFDALWGIDAGWFESPNRRRGGWSGVSRLELTRPEGTACTVFLKRQENHGTFSFRHPVQGVPTFEREFRLIQRYRAAGIPTLEPVYFAVRGQRAMLMTVALDGFLPLDSLAGNWQPYRKEILATVALLTRKLHDARIQHNCFYPKHVFVKVDAGGTAEARVIDLEKSRWRPLRLICTLRDLDTLNRYARGWRRTERLYFLKTYLGLRTLTPKARRLWRTLAKRATRKKGQ